MTGEECRRHADLLLCVVVAGREGATRTVCGDCHLSFSDSRRAAAENDADSATTVACQRSIDGVLDLRQCGEQQAVVAAGVVGEHGGDFRQVAACATNSGRAVEQPAVFHDHAAAVAGEEPPRHFICAAAERINDAECG